MWNFHTMSTIRERKMEGEKKEIQMLSGEEREWRGGEDIQG